MKIKTIIMMTLIAFTFSCGVKKQEPVKGEIQEEEVVKPETIEEEPVSEPAPLEVESTPEPFTPPAQIVAVIASVVNIRNGPGMKNKVISKVKMGDELELLGKTGSWFNVRLSNGVEGWIYKKLVK